MKVRLGDIAYLYNGDRGKNYPSSDEIKKSGDVPFVNAGLLSEDHIVFEDMNYISQNKYDELRAGKFQPGDILYCLRGSLGKKALVRDGEYGAIASSLVIIRPDTEKVRADYLLCALDSPDIKRQLREANNGSSQPNLSAKSVSNYAIDLPDLKRQGEVVERVYKVQQLIRYRNRELDVLDELIKARFVELFNDGASPLRTVEKLCSDIVDCPHTTPKYVGILKHPAIRTSEIKKGYITWDTMRYVSDEEYKERIARLRPEPGDIVYGREGTFGNAAVLPDGYHFCLGQRVMLLRPDYSKCTSEYLLHAVISDDVYRQAVGKNNASTVAHVNVKDVKQFRIPLPSLEKQNKFAMFVKQVDKSKVIIQETLDRT